MPVSIIKDDVIFAERVRAGVAIVVVDRASKPRRLWIRLTEPELTTMGEQIHADKPG